MRRFRLMLFGLLLLGLPLVTGFICLPLIQELPLSPTVAPGSFSPSISVTLSDTNTSANSDVTTTLSVPTAGDYLPYVVSWHVPAAWGMALDSAIADGSLAGSFNVLVGGGSDNGPCNPPGGPPTDLPLLEATTNSAGPTVSAADVAPINGVRDILDDDDDDGIPNGAQQYPSFLPPGPYHLRWYGQSSSPGTDGWNHTFVNLVMQDEPDGSYRILAVIGDPALPPFTNATSMCTPASATFTILGQSTDNPDSPATEPTVPQLTNPGSAGTYTFTAGLISELDADGDTVGNNLDNCAMAANPSQADPDSDGIGGAASDCDPTDGDTNSGDHDLDGWLNAFDNCPTMANTTQTDSDLDGIGDPCDPGSTTPTGGSIARTCHDAVGVGGGDDPPPGVCVAGTPTPGPTVTTTSTPTATATATPTDTPTATVTPTPGACTPPFTDLGIGVDTDCDGATDANENGTDPTKCGTRNPDDMWDFYDVPVATIHSGGDMNNRDSAVTLFNDVLGVLEYSGAIENGPPNGGGRDYDDDVDGDGVKDGVAYDREVGAAWPELGAGKSHTTAPNFGSGAVTLFVDVLLVLDQSGHICPS